MFPKSAVNNRCNARFILDNEIINDTTAVRSNFLKGIETDSLVQVLNSNLTPKDRVISEGSYGLPDTAKVEIIK